MGKIRPVKTVNIFDKTISKDFPSILRKVRDFFPIESKLMNITP